MADQPTNPGELLATPGIGAVVSIAALLRLLATPPDAPEKPAKALQHPATAAKQTFQGIYYIVHDWGWGDALSYFAAAAVSLIVLSGGALGQVTIWVFEQFSDTVVDAGLDFIDTFRKEIDPRVANVAVMILNELLGTDFQADSLPGGTDLAGHLARAQDVGALFHQQMMTQLANTDPTNAATGNIGAERFTGQIVNFGVATALLGLFGELGSGGFIKNFRLIGEQVSSGLGLSRLHRMAMRPLMNTMIAQPYSWYLNQKFHPTQFKEGDLINPFNQELMGHDVIFKSMDLLGYSQDKVEALIRLHSKKVPLADLELFDRYGIVPRDQTLNLMRELGYPDEISVIILEGVDLHRADAALAKLVDAAETSVVDGHITIDDFSALLDSLPLGHHEKAFRLQALQYKTKAPHAHLTTAQAQKAFEEGIWDLTQLEDYLTRRGYSADDVQTLELETLLALAKLAEAKKVAQFAWERKAAAAEKKGQPIPPKPAILAGG